MASGHVLASLDKFGKAWKLHCGCELMLDADYSWYEIEAFSRSRPGANEGFREASAEVRRLFPQFKVSLEKTNPPVIFITDTRVKQPLLPRPVKLEPFDGDVAGLVGFLYKHGVLVSLPWVHVTSMWPLDLRDLGRGVRVPAMQTTVGDYLATALIDEKLGYGMCFALITSPNGIRQAGSAVTFPNQARKTYPLESVVYVQSGNPDFRKFQEQH